MKTRKAVGKYKDKMMPKVQSKYKILTQAIPLPTIKEMNIYQDLCEKAKSMNAIRYGVAYHCSRRPYCLPIRFEFGIETEDKYYLITPATCWEVEKK